MNAKAIFRGMLYHEHQTHHGQVREGESNFRDWGKHMLHPLPKRNNTINVISVRKNKSKISDGPAAVELVELTTKSTISMRNKRW